MTGVFDLHVSPLVSLAALIPLFASLLALLFVSFALRRTHSLFRAACGCALFATLLNPSLSQETRIPAHDIAAIVLDRSPSQSFGERTKRTEKAFAALKEKLQSVPGLELRVIGENEPADPLASKTMLFDKLDRVLSDVPSSRRAGVVFITDGQVHDVPQTGDYGPVHTLLTGSKKEKDRRLAILEAPSYGLVGQSATIRYRIEDTEKNGEATVTIRQGGQKPRIERILVNTDQAIEINVDHTGQNIIDMDVSPEDGELTLVNNRSPVIVNGVRDRLRVLLVSGQPHAGGRTWRNLLTSDPGVDLVHFTILREPEKLDATPRKDLSLIAFPFEELFETRLYDFDLIIFDRYGLNNILPPIYYSNIARYIREGGALLEASGPSYATENSLYNTDLGTVLPAAPTGQVIDAPYKPELTEIGHRHPVTENLSWGKQGEGWGRWLRQIGVAATDGEIVMTGANHTPLLILKHSEKGRVAQLASDQIWLWSRGFEGGGPDLELLRRLAHWLMKEPELEENALDASIDGNALLIKRRSLNESPVTVTVVSPDGHKSEIPLAQGQHALEGRMQINQPGVYAVSDGTQERFVMAGALNQPELSDVLSTPEKLMPLIRNSGGAALWLERVPSPDVKILPGGRDDYSGNNWIGLRRNGSYTTASITEEPLLPQWGAALLILTLILGTWWMEGRAR